jgi:hypothetical protein
MEIVGNNVILPILEWALRGGVLGYLAPFSEYCLRSLTLINYIKAYLLIIIYVFSSKRV